MRPLLWRGVLVVGIAFLVAAAPAAEAQAQAPPSSPEAGAIASCLCLKRSLDAEDADLTAAQHSYDAARDEVARLDAQLHHERTTMDVNDPQAVARFRQLLGQRDAAYARQSGALFTQLSRVTRRYNADVKEYNGRCANRPRSPILLRQVEATLSCPAR